MVEQHFQKICVRNLHAKVLAIGKVGKMIHKYSLIAEFEFDDENGEYSEPSIREIERKITPILSNLKGELSGLYLINLEAERGTLSEAFGIK